MTLFVGCILLVSQTSKLQAAFTGDPPDDHHPWALRDDNRPQPPIVTPGKQLGDAPSDALVLFDGSAKSMENWVHEKPKEQRKLDWIVKDGTLVCQPGAGYIMTKEEFGDIQFHIEWKAPSNVEGTGQARGNSGVFLMGNAVDGIEVQILDNYENPTYADGTAGAVYGITPPSANALRESSEWQSYDIILRRPLVHDGRVVDEGSITVLVNGVVVQAAVPLDGGGGYYKRTYPDRLFPDSYAISLQDHKNAVQFRNIWVRPLRPRPLDGGLDGRLSKEVTLAKRNEIAAELRADADGLQGSVKTLRLLESLVYQFDESIWKEAEGDIQAFIERIESLSSDERQSEKKRIQEFAQALRFLNKFERIEDVSQLDALQAVLKAEGWKFR